MTHGWKVIVPLRWDNEGILLTLLAESKLLLGGLMDRCGEKGICEINSCIQIPEDVLLCSSKEMVTLQQVQFDLQFD